MFFLKELGGVPGVEGDGTQRIFDLVGNGGQEGALVSLAMALPVLVLVAEKERKSVPVIAVNALVLGVLIAWVKVSF